MYEQSGISIIIPTFNCGEIIHLALDSIISQDYPSEKIEILIVDDASTDDTLDVVSTYPTKILHNGRRNIESGKSIGLENALHEFVLFMDADNVLPSSSWLNTMIRPLQENPEIVGSESAYFSYDPSDALTDRYCSLFGINDPFAFYLGNRDRLMHVEKKWSLYGESIDKGGYFLVSFNGTNIPTIGSIGFLGRKSLLKKTDYSPYFFHIDSNVQLINAGYNTYALVKNSIRHFHSKSTVEFLRKLHRNIRLYLTKNHLRSYKWGSSTNKLLIPILTMMFLIRPTYDSIKGYRKLPDLAWFLNPFLSIMTVFIYGINVIIYYMESSFLHKKV